MFRIVVALALIACSSSSKDPDPAAGSSTLASATGSETGSAPGSAAGSSATASIDAPAVASESDIDAAVTQLFELWKAGKLADIRDGSHPELKHTLRVETLKRMHDTMADVAGAFVRVQPPFEHATDPSGDAVVTGKAIYDKGALTFKLSLRAVDGKPLLTDFNLTLPKELQVTANPADAEKVARQMLDGLVHGKVKTELVDPAALVDLASPAELAAKIKSVLDKLGALKSIGPPLQAGCGAAQCIRYELVGSKRTHVAVFEVGFKIRRWLIRSFDIGEPKK